MNKYFKIVNNLTDARLIELIDNDQEKIDGWHYWQKSNAFKNFGYKRMSNCYIDGGVGICLDRAAVRGNFFLAT